MQGQYDTFVTVTPLRVAIKALCEAQQSGVSARSAAIGSLYVVQQSMIGRSSEFLLKKGLGRRGKGPEKVHVEPVTNQTPGTLDLEALPLRDIAWVQLRDLLCSQLSSSKLALWPELSSRIRVRDRCYEIFDLAAL